MPGETIARERLIRCVQRAVARPLTLVAAPPGAGKTILLARWARRHPGVDAVAWVTLDERARTLHGLWHQLVDAIGRTTLRGPEPRDEAEAAERLAAALGPGTGLVLDDAHEADGRPLSATIRALLAQPDAPRVVLSTRIDPGLPLQRLRVADRLSELRNDELAFTAAEATELLTRQGITLTDDEIRVLVRRTEGWAAGLRLAAVLLAGHPDPSTAVTQFAGDDRAVVAYLIEEVLDRQPPAARELLLRTAVLDRVSGPLADALTGATDGQATLEELVRRNAFVVPMDRQGRWFRYHGLLRELLRSQLAHRGPDVVAEQHRRAAQWLARAGLPDAAIPHAARAAEWDVVGGLLADHALRLRTEGDGTVIDDALEQMPAAALTHRPHVALVAAARSFDRGDAVRGDMLLCAATAARERLAAGRRERFTRDLSLLRLERARLSGDAHTGLRERAAAHASPFDAPDGDRRSRAVAHLELGRLRIAAGDGLAERELRAAAELATAAEDRHTARRATAERAMLYAMTGRLRQATLVADAVLAEAEPGDALPMAHLARSLVAAEQGNTLLAAAQLAQVGALPHAVYGRVPALQLALVGARVVGPADVDAAAASLAALDAATTGWELPDRCARLACAARLRLLSRLGHAQRALAEEAVPSDDAGCRLSAALALLLGGDAPAAQRWLRPLGDDVPAPIVVGTLAVAAACAATVGDPGVAPRLAEEALDAAEPEGIRLPLADATPPLEPVLAHLLRFGTAHRSLIGEILELARAGATASGRGDVTALREELSARELAVLRYLPTMLTSQEIAGELFVTLNTVKSHLKSIYRKLDARGRRDAVRRARELGLVAPSGLAAEGRAPQR